MGGTCSCVAYPSHGQAAQALSEKAACLQAYCGCGLTRGEPPIAAAGPLAASPPCRFASLRAAPWPERGPRVAEA